jgi:hypothetical protein
MPAISASPTLARASPELASSPVGELVAAVASVASFDSSASMRALI